MILTMAKYHENLLRDSPLSLLFIVKFFSSLETKMVVKIPNETFLRITRYLAVIVQSLYPRNLSFGRCYMLSLITCYFQTKNRKELGQH